MVRVPARQAQLRLRAARNMPLSSHQRNTRCTTCSMHRDRRTSGHCCRHGSVARPRPSWRPRQSQWRTLPSCGRPYCAVVAVVDGRVRSILRDVPASLTSGTPIPMLHPGVARPALRPAVVLVVEIEEATGRRLDQLLEARVQQLVAVEHLARDRLTHKPLTCNLQRARRNSCCDSHHSRCFHAVGCRRDDYSPRGL
jgi:hypothetical protein